MSKIALLWVLAWWIGWDGVTALASVALVVLGIFTIVYAGLQLADFRRESRIKHLIDLVDQFEQEPLTTYRKTLGEARVQYGILRDLDTAAPPREMYDVLNFFEHMGYLLDGGYLDREGVFVEFHYWIFRLWVDALELIREEQSENPVYYQHFSKMEKLMEECARKRKANFSLPTLDDVLDFYAQEAHIRPGTPIARQPRRTMKLSDLSGTKKPSKHS